MSTPARTSGRTLSRMYSSGALTGPLTGAAMSFLLLSQALQSSTHDLFTFAPFARTGADLSLGAGLRARGSLTRSLDRARSDETRSTLCTYASARRPRGKQMKLADSATMTAKEFLSWAADRPEGQRLRAGRDRSVRRPHRPRCHDGSAADASRGSVVALYARRGCGRQALRLLPVAQRRALPDPRSGQARDHPSLPLGGRRRNGDPARRSDQARSAGYRIRGVRVFRNALAVAGATDAEPDGIGLSRQGRRRSASPAS